MALESYVSIYFKSFVIHGGVVSTDLGPVLARDVGTQITVFILYFGMVSI